jgi:HlyD family secretion protein
MSNILNKTKGWKLPLIAIIGMIFALITVLGRAEAPAKEPVTMPPQSSYEHSVAGIGVVEPKSEIIAIGTELSGVVRTAHIKIGDIVKAGDHLFTLDQRDVNSQIKILEASLASAKVQAEDAVAQYALVKSVDDKRAVARDDYNRRKYGASLAKTRIAEIEAQLAQANTTKERLTIKAPIDGEILSVDIRPGEFASAGATSTPLIRMGDTSMLYVRAEIDEENAGRVKSGAVAKGFKRGDTKTAIPLRFVRFEPYIRPKQNLAVAGQRVDTRVLQIIYAMPQGEKSAFVGEQMDVFIDEKAGVQ